MRWDIAPSNAGTGLPLEGVRVLDLSRVLAGPLCAMVVGDLGADVIKVESPEGDAVRALAPPSLDGLATYYLSVNRHRRNLTLDLRAADDRAVLRLLVSQADAIVENYLPHQAELFGVRELRDEFPDVVWITITPASSGTPLAERPTFDLLAQARSGLMSVTGSAESGPMKIGAPLADVVTGLYAAIGLITGLFARIQGRPGRHFEAPLLESAMTALVNQAQGFLAAGVAPQRLGNHHPSIAPYGPVAAQDGMLLLAVGTDAQYELLVNELGDDELSARREWLRNDVRVQERDALHVELDRVFGRLSVAEWLDRLARANVPCAPIYSVPEALAQPDLAEDFIATVDSVVGPLSMMRSPLRVDGQRPPLRSGPRGLGEDNDLRNS